MQLSPTSRTTRVRRLLAISAAAVAVMIGPTACNYGVAGGLHGTGSSSGDVPGTDRGSDNAGQQPVVVPVADTSQSPSSGDRRTHGRTHGSGDQPATTTSPDAAATDTTDPAATADPVAPPTDPTDPAAAAAVAGGQGTVGAGGKDGKNNGLAVLGRDCTASKLPPHDGFQNSPACVNTEMGEIAAKDKLPSLLITEAPRVVGMNQAFTLKVSTRNLVRDRFLGAKAGGYYLESSFLEPNGPNKGLQRGHFHTACRILPNTNEAPDSSVDPKFFLATEDGGGTSKPDTVTIPVPAIGAPGILQCTSWAGDGSHRTPMMTQANETPAIDSVRIFVTRRDQPVRYDAAAATTDSGKTDTAHAQAAGGQKPDPNAAVPAAPDAAAAPAAPVDDSGKPIDPAASPAAPSDGATPAGDTAPPATN